VKLVPLRRIEGAADELSDAALVAACGAGELAALGALFDRYHDALRAFLARRTGTDERDLDDLVQATFEALPAAARGFGGRAQVKTWLFGVANNVARHHARAEARRRALSRAAMEAVPVPAGDELLTRERAARLRAAIDGLPDAQRETFVLVYLDGIAGGEVAALLGVREGTVWARLHEARARLRAALGGVVP
jgi:RNA polymerase sigma-70 factor (ECF subfamily)